MAHLKDLTVGAMVSGILPNDFVTVVQAKWHGLSVLELTYKDSIGNPRCELLYRDHEPMREIASKEEDTDRKLTDPATFEYEMR